MGSPRPHKIGTPFYRALAADLGVPDPIKLGLHFIGIMDGFGCPWPYKIGIPFYRDLGTDLGVPGPIKLGLHFIGI